MKIPTFSELLKSKLLLAGLVFLIVNLGYSYMFYQVNSYKISIILLGVSILAIWYDLFFPKYVSPSIPWKQLFLISLPLLATLPGYIWYQGVYNYNFKYELSSNLVLIVWIAYLFRCVATEEDLHPFFFLIGITVIYVSVWAFLERIGYHPLEWGAIPPSRVKSTFGNINYFAGFLVVLLPLLLMLCLPERVNIVQKADTDSKIPYRLSGFYITVFALAILSLFLTQTRAAWGASFVGLVLVVILYIISYASKSTQKTVFIISAIAILIGLIALILAFIFVDYLPKNRLTLLLTLEGWTPRFAGWVPAINSIKESPIIGFGLGSSYNLYFKFADPNARLIHSEHSYNHVHSEILEYTQEAGFLGLIIFIAFWTYLAFLLIRLIRSNQTNALLKKLAIGILGGFVSYHLQSLFSVAPRMMVVKLPLYTLIALTFIVDKLSKPDEILETNRTLMQRLTSLSPAVLILGFLWIIFTPWLIGQYKFVELQRSRPSLIKVENLEKMVREYPDAYALDYLAHLQMQYKRTDELQRTVNIIDKVIPNYRELGYTKAVLAILQQDLEKAKKVALNFQERQDRYHKPTIFLLMGLAFDTNDYLLFKRQLELFTRLMVFNSGLHYSLKSTSAAVTFEIMETPFEIEDLGDTFKFKWNEQLVNNLFNAGRSVRIARSFSQKDRNTLISYLSFHFSRTPYFQLKVKEQYQGKSQNEINENMRDYFITSEQSEKEMKALNDKQKRELYRTRPSDRLGLEKKQLEEREVAAKPFNDKLEMHSEYLRERTNWDTFLKRRSFVNAFMNEFVNIIYPMQNG